MKTLTETLIFFANGGVRLYVTPIEIVKQIEPKTFKMEDEKEIGITKNHRV